MAHLFVSGLPADQWLAYYLKRELEGSDNRVTFGTNPIVGVTRLPDSNVEAEPFQAVIAILTPAYLKMGLWEQTRKTCIALKMPLIPIVYVPSPKYLAHRELGPVYFFDYQFEKALLTLHTRLINLGVAMAPLPRTPVYGYGETAPMAKQLPFQPDPLYKSANFWGWVVIIMITALFIWGISYKLSHDSPQTSAEQTQTATWGTVRDFYNQTRTPTR